MSIAHCNIRIVLSFVLLFLFPELERGQWDFDKLACWTHFEEYLSIQAPGWLVEVDWNWYWHYICCRDKWMHNMPLLGLLPLVHDLFGFHGCLLGNIFSYIALWYTLHKSSLVCLWCSHGHNSCILKHLVFCISFLVWYPMFTTKCNVWGGQESKPRQSTCSASKNFMFFAASMISCSWRIEGILWTWNVAKRSYLAIQMQQLVPFPLIIQLALC